MAGPEAGLRNHKPLLLPESSTPFTATLCSLKHRNEVSIDRRAKLRQILSFHHGILGEKCMVTQLGSSREFLDAVYEKLGYQDGSLLSSSASPPGSTDDCSVETWTNKGEWLSLAAQVAVEKVFFVDNDPVIVFHQAPDDEPLRLMEVFRRTWCMARPQLLFIAFPGGLDVYSLNQPPARTLEEWKEIEPLDVVRRVCDVGQELQAYRREQVETRRVFSEKEDLGKIEQRADKRLILDLKEVRQQLLSVDPDVDPRHIHALIGRSIFIRYLEDRGILTPDYFSRIAQNPGHPKWSQDWLEVLEEPESDLAPDSGNRRYSRVLRDKDLTYALFGQLTEHFNGDMFPQDPEEERSITETHLQLLRGFLLGDVNPQQQKLFLWAYDFRLIPLELISSIYEEFYHQSGQEDIGTHYTPSVLVEYVLSQVLTTDCLAQEPRILDFACGSAIFLVQAYRRIIRFQESQLGRPLTNQELRHILRDQIAGIEINEEAIYVAAFSLYLALLHYQEPKSILAQIAQTDGDKPLPYIIMDAEQPHEGDSDHYDVLYRGNTFDLTSCEREFLRRKLDEVGRFKGRIEWKRLYDSEANLPFESNSFDVIIGNPPWGYATRSKDSSELCLAQEQALRWCNVFGWPVGDKELSQAFIARSLSLLKPDGQCGLLVSAGVFLKRGRKSLEFRKRWLENSRVEQLTNFMHVRDEFFSSAISPFCFVKFHPGSLSCSRVLEYWSAKKAVASESTQFVVLTLYDLHKVHLRELIADDVLWKVYWWGNHRDQALVAALRNYDSLGNVIDQRDWDRGRGFEADFSSGDHNPSAWLGDYRKLPTRNFERYGPVSGLEDTPELVHRYGNRAIYEGWRLLVKRGITQANGANGRIEARLEHRTYAVLNSIHGINLDKASPWERKVLTGIMWSSLARYFFFMTTSSWGPWHHEIYLEDGLLSLPVRFPDDQGLRLRITSIVDELREWNPTEQSLFEPGGLSADQIRANQERLERQLDEAIFELYQLNEPERDLILDLCETGLEFFYRKDKSSAVQRVPVTSPLQGTSADLHGERQKEKGLEGYLYAFLQMWNPQLETINAEFSWRIIRAPDAPMLAVVFTIQQKNADLHLRTSDNEQAWFDLVEELSETLRYPISKRIYIDGMVRIVTDTDVIVIKRDERRLWTRSRSREDAEATLLQAMIRQETVRNQP